ncbi:TPA: accessory Sec system translocase SecA2 [Streptococcus suis]|nr:accessory Sec system translocase SecA2 [Streptococcus suis]HEM3623145.1 accessory Sec system translocase SecA2 [Streptococcus suis]HEM3627378.1 accessory Sec system translocase SecA2 [Streptococcus suis]HEM3632010.1 accessory Sec system translocase SecA2 [Streptococcus suis]HEM3640455.1 accessory Sec system translocase SecA2 [Streptococcus suis]
MKKVFSLNAIRLFKLRRILRKVNSYKETMRVLSDDQLALKTDEFRRRLQEGATLDQLLPEAYAVVREVDYRVLGMFPYDVQVLGAIVLHQGNLAEMKTGEGKTLTATMPLYLNALSGKGTYLVTTNSYLAVRDAEEMKPVFNFLGLTVGTAVTYNSDEELELEQKKQIYQSDIVYTTNSALGFDYLIDNLASELSQKFIRDFHYVIIDEADEVLLDMAQTPLIISGSPRLQSNLYSLAKNFIVTLKEGVDYTLEQDTRDVWLTTRGIDEMERYFSIKNIYVKEHGQLVRHINLLLKAYHQFERGKEYVVRDGEVLLLDQSNGRALEGTKLQGGLHQAIESKEDVDITEEMRSVASITYQNLFLLFDKMSGMSGTAKSAEVELNKIYRMLVIQVPPNRQTIRKDLPDKIYTTLPEKIAAIVDLTKMIHSTGQPILIVTSSVRMSQLFSDILLMEGIPHSLLNANNVAKEAQMIAEAGQKGTVTVATTMAGRGTDIKITDEVRALGGLYIIGTERMTNERIDLQMRGRSGRQGDPGISQFFVSLEDNVLIRHGEKWIEKYLRKNIDKVCEDVPTELKHKKFRKAVQQAQKQSEERAMSARMSTVEFERSIKVQRDYIYQARNIILSKTGRETIETVNNYLCEAIEYFIKEHDSLSLVILERFILENISYDINIGNFDIDIEDKEAVKAYLMELVQGEIKNKEKIAAENFITFCNTVLLKAIDEAWVEEVDYLQQLRTVVAGRATAQRNPMFEYHREALIAYKKMKLEIAELVLQYFMLSRLSFNEDGNLSVLFV